MKRRTIPPDKARAATGWYEGLKAKYPPIPCAACGTQSLTVKEAGGSCLRCTIAGIVRQEIRGAGTIRDAIRRST